MPALVSSRTTGGRQRQPKPLPGITREDSDDELGTEDLPWEYIYQSDIAESSQPEDGTSRKRKRGVGQNRIIGARSGDFECKLGDTVLLKAEGSNEAWVGLICEFGDDDGEMSAYFMWFSSEKEIRNKQKKRTDFLPVSDRPCLIIRGAPDSHICLTPERVIHIALLGPQSPGFHQRNSTCHVRAGIQKEIPQRQGPAKRKRVWESFYMPPRLQYEDSNVYRRIHLGGHIPRS
jgi:hypothetical protein